MTSHFLTSLRIRPLAAMLALAFGFMALAPNVSASPIPSTAILSETTRAGDLATIRLSLEHKQVQQRLSELGFTNTEIQKRLANASDSELHQLATQSQAIMAGGDGGIIITVLLVIVLVMVILHLR